MDGNFYHMTFKSNNIVFREERRNASRLYNPMSIKELSNLDPNTPWLAYINNILSREIIQVRTLDFFTNNPWYIDKTV